MRLVRRPWIWIARFRKRRGYGVHSPFAYAFLRGVVFEREAYYAYDDLNRLHPWWIRWSQAYPLLCRRLLFRLANFTHPRTLVLMGDRPVERAYLEAAVPSARWTRLTDGIADFIFVAHEELPNITLPQMPPSGMVVAEGIHHDKASQRIWKALQSNPQTVLTFDLYDYGIILFNSNYPKRHYIVNF